MGLDPSLWNCGMGNNKIKQIYAGYQVSFALTESGKLYNWGNSYLLDVRIPAELQGNIDKFVANTNVALALSKDGEVRPLTNKSSLYKSSGEVQGHVRSGADG